MRRDGIVLGADSSTTSTKVIAFDLRGNTVAVGTRRHPVFTDRPGRVEQRADDWWNAFRGACTDVTRSPEVRGTEVLGIGLTHQRFTFVPVDADIRPLRNAILWNDLRCGAEAEWARTNVGTGRIFASTGYPPGQWTLYKAMWLRDHEPELYRRTFKLMLVADFIIHRLTGRLVTSQGYAAMTGALDIADGRRWAGGIIRELGVREDLWIGDILAGGVEAGTVSEAAARETGLPAGLPVFTGAGDQPCGSLGAGVMEPGQLGINGGTSCSNEFLVGRLPSRTKPDYFIELSPTGDYIIENDIPSGGSAVMNWYRDRFGEEDVRAAEAAGIDPWERIYGRVGETAPGNDGLMMVPYLQGVYGPYWDQDARAVIMGLRTEHGKPELVRALLEGVAYEARREVSLMEAGSGTPVDEIRMYGGSARSGHWNRIFADMFDTTVLVPSTEETTALGAAMCAAVGSGAVPDFGRAVSAMVRIDRRFEPDPENAVRYRRFFEEVYVKLYDSVRESVTAAARISREYPL